MLHGHMSNRSEEQLCNDTESYVDRHDNGLTRRSMRFACGLPADAPSPKIGDVADHADPVATGLSEMRAVIDEVIKYLLDNDHEYVTHALCRVVAALPGANPDVQKAYFDKLINNGFWK